MEYTNPKNQYLDYLTFPFQSYFRQQLGRALKFLVEATISDLFIYMQTVLTYGPYREYAENRFLSTRNCRRRLRECIIDVLSYLRDTENSIECSGEGMEKEFYMPIIKASYDDFVDVYHHIFDVLREAGANGADRKQIADYIGSKYDDDEEFYMASLNRLLISNCIFVETVRHKPVYKINFRSDFYSISFYLHKITTFRAYYIYVLKSEWQH